MRYRFNRIKPWKNGHMGLKEQIERAAESFKHAVEHAAADVKDAANEASHRGEAEAERTKREVAGDEMTAGEKATSMVNQGVNETQAEIDRLKRKTRDEVL